MANIYFTNEHLVTDFAFNFTVVCVSDANLTQMKYSAMVKPKYATTQGIVEREQYFQTNISYIIVGICLFILLVSLVIVLFARKLRELRR